MITKDEILKGETLPHELEANLASLLESINKLRKLYNKPMIVTSGYRTLQHNTAIGGSKNSWHCKCMAIDIKDDGELEEFCRKDDYQVLKECGLWMEKGSSTKGWAHFDLHPRKNREFIP